ncbi:MAG: VWA domain-containing protein [Micromonosporaceae bacterium]|nr:VWA domain-containing protein [Micromonosporaceae bacterium]
MLTIVAWFSYQYLVGELSGPVCDSPAAVEIAAAPEIVPALTDVVNDLPPAETAENCWRMTITSYEPEQVSVSLTRPSEGGVSADTRPDVWIPDSTYWLRHARANGHLDLPEQGASIANSPVVLALVEPAARKLGWPRKLDWKMVLGTEKNPSPVRTGVADPGHSPVGLSGLITTQQVMGSSEHPERDRIKALREMSKNVSVVAPDLFGKLPQNDDPTTISTSLGAFPASEQSVLSYNSRAPAVPLVNVYAEQPGPSLDYPFTVLPHASKKARATAKQALKTLLSADARQSLRSRGFRTPSGAAGPGFPNTGAVLQRTVAPVPLPQQDQVDDLLTVWTGINRSGRILTVIDVSGSMADIVPGTDQSLMDMTRIAVIQGLNLFRDTTEVGAWIFASNLEDGRPYRELVPTGPLYANKQQLMAAAGRVQAVQGGGTALYDTTLAAYQTARKSWDPARINVVLVIADGENNAGQLSREQLLAKLKKLRDPKRPLAIINIGLGPGVNKAELDAISKGTGGQAFVARDPTKMQEVFLSALAKLTCVPPHCENT